MKKIITLLTLCVLGNIIAETTTVMQKTNPALEMFNENLVMHLNFDDSTVNASLMDGELKSHELNKVTYTDGVLGKAINQGRIKYFTEFSNVDFGADGSIVMWISLTSDDPKNDKDSNYFLNVSQKGQGAIVLQRQCWVQSSNIMAALAAPSKKLPHARIFQVSRTDQWPVNQWHMITITWSVDSLSLFIDDGTKKDQVALKMPIPMLTKGDPKGIISAIILEIKENTIAIDEFMVLNKKLSEDDIKSLYDAILKASK